MRLRGEDESRRSNDVLRVSSPVSVRVDEIEYRIVGDEAEVCGYTRSGKDIFISSHVFVPVRGKSCPVTRIAPDSFKYGSVKSVTIPRTVQILESSCFEDCKFLESVSFEPDSQLVCIKSKAFWCSSLRSITIPLRVEILESRCFSECQSLESIFFETDSGQEKRITISGSEQKEIQLSQNIQLFLRECCPRTEDVSVTMVENPR
jgi:hypothetical protein